MPRALFVMAVGIAVGILAASPPGAARASADDETAPADTPPDQERFAVFAEMAARYAIRKEGSDEPLTMHPRSLLNWSNPTRNQERGGVFVWLDEGRPAVIGSIFAYPSQNRLHCKHALHSVSQTPLTAVYESSLAWSPRTPGVRWQELDGEAVAKSERQRLLQMRQIARRFSVTLRLPKEGKTTLRLVPQPLFRYASEKHQVVDGAVFSFAIATDPEALLLVELTDDADEPDGPRWRYAFTRFHFYKLEATDRGGRAVWTAEEDLSQMRNPLGNPVTIEKTYNSFTVSNDPLP
jgi:hypothetical protein